MEAEMNIRNGLWFALSLGLVVWLTGASGCGVAEEYNYFSEVTGGGPSTGESTDVPKIMREMRTANLYLVDSLTTMNKDGAQRYSVQMYEMSKALGRTQPAVALQSPDDVAKYKKIADDLAEIIVQVGVASRDDHQEQADLIYAQAFPLCNRCHLQFRAALKAKPIEIPDIEKVNPTPSTGETPSTTPLPATPETPAPATPTPETPDSK